MMLTMTTAPTNAERVIGHDVALEIAYGNGQVDVAAAVAQALADQRAKYEAVAREFDILAGRLSSPEGRMSYRDAAERIRQVAR